MYNRADGGTAMKRLYRIGAMLAAATLWAAASCGRADTGFAVYLEGRPTASWRREAALDMRAQNNYAAWPGVIATFRGGPFRQNAFFQYSRVDIAQSTPKIAWRVFMGSADAALMGQPAIVKWPLEIRQMMNLFEEKRVLPALKEVIFASPDGSIYFLDLYDGQPTRRAIKVGHPLTGSVSVDPSGVPRMMASVQAGGESRRIMFSLIDQTQLFTVKGGSSGSVLFERGGDTAVFAGEDGQLYTVRLGTSFDYRGASLSVSPETVSCGAGSAMAGDIAMYGAKAYAAGASGMLACVDTTAMVPLWTAEVGATTAAIALDFDPGGPLALYTGSIVKELGLCSIRRLDAGTGREDWAFTAEAGPVSGGPGGCVASPLVGEKGIGDLVIFTLAGTEEGGQIIALDKRTGVICWQQPMADYGYSSPVAVYDDSGKAYILQGDSGGSLRVLDGRTGVMLSSIRLDGPIAGSPAVYDRTLVVATGGQDATLYGITLW